VLNGDGHTGATYELGGPSFTLTELAATISEVLGTDVAYRDIPVSDYTGVLIGAGLPAEMAAVLADADDGLARGELYTDSADLQTLIGRPPTTRGDAFRDAAARSGA
jgi:NAD(P)H dehydrogenase (quinone)